MSLAEPVDAMLQEAARLLGSGPPPTVAAPTPPSPVPPHPQWEGDASERARQVSTQLAGQRDQLHAAHAKAASVINNAATITTEARSQIAGIQSEWERDKAAVGAFSNTPQGQAALATAGQARLQEATGVITDAVNRFGQAAQGVQAARFDLPMKFGPGDLPLEPQFGDDPATMNESQARGAYEELKREIDAHNAKPPNPLRSGCGRAIQRRSRLAQRQKGRAGGQAAAAGCEVGTHSATRNHAGASAPDQSGTTG